MFLDVSANQGLYTIITAKNKNCKKVFEFEPVSETYGVLKENIILNWLINKTTLIKKADDKNIGKKTTKIIPGNTDAASISVSNKTDNLDVKSQIISTINHEALNALNIDADVKVLLKINV